MNSPTTGLLVASIVFGLMAAVQLGRLLIRPEVLVNGQAMPLWPSALAFLVMAALGVWLLRLWRIARQVSP